MKLFEAFRRRGTIADPKSVATGLFSYARQGLDEHALPGLPIRNRQTVSLVYFLTKAAIVIQWLRIIGREQPKSVRAKVILEQFEELNFGPLDGPTRLFVVEQIRKLTVLLSAIKSFVQDETAEKDQAPRKILELSESWFALAVDDQGSLPLLALAHGTDLVYAIYGEMNRLGEMVGEGVFGKGVSQ